MQTQNGEISINVASQSGSQPVQIEPLQDIYVVSVLKIKYDAFL